VDYRIKISLGTYEKIKTLRLSSDSLGSIVENELLSVYRSKTRFRNLGSLFDEMPSQAFRHLDSLDLLITLRLCFLVYIRVKPFLLIDSRMRKSVGSRLITLHFTDARAIKLLDELRLFGLSAVFCRAVIRYHLQKNTS
jgi:hypothetical protein